MEPISNTAKRKKRKTRKCLNEIRKRSRRTEQNILNDNDGKRNENMLYYKNIQNCMITHNRLTLTLFPKAIQSKTITRPALMELQNKPNLKFKELVKGAALVNTQNTARVKIPINQLYENKKFVSDNCDLNRSALEADPIILNTEENKDNFELFSSMDESSIKYNNNTEIHSESTVTTSSTQSLHEDNGYTLYEEFMSETPAFLQVNSKLIQEDIMKKTKALLQNLFVENCYQECENNILKCIKNDTPKNMYFKTTEVVHNPKDYIRQSHIQEQNEYYKRDSSISRSSSISHSSLRAPSSLTSPSDTPLSVIIHDTPEYSYYPHRLN